MNIDIQYKLLVYFTNSCHIEGLLVDCPVPCQYVHVTYPLACTQILTIPKPDADQYVVSSFKQSYHLLLMLDT